MLYQKGLIKSIYTDTNQYTDKNNNIQTYDITKIQIEVKHLNGKISIEEYSFSKSLVEKDITIVDKSKQFINKEVFLPVYKFSEIYHTKDGKAGLNHRNYIAGLPEIFNK